MAYFESYFKLIKSSIVKELDTKLAGVSVETYLHS